MTQLEPIAFTVAEFCLRFGIGRTKLYREINAGRLKARKLGKRTLILRAEADDWLNGLAEMRVPATPK